MHVCARKKCLECCLDSISDYTISASCIMKLPFVTNLFSLLITDRHFGNLNSHSHPYWLQSSFPNFKFPFKILQWPYFKTLLYGHLKYFSRCLFHVCYCPDKYCTKESKSVIILFYIRLYCAFQGLKLLLHWKIRTISIALTFLKNQNLFPLV